MSRSEEIYWNDILIVRGRCHLNWDTTGGKVLIANFALWTAFALSWLYTWLIDKISIWIVELQYPERIDNICIDPETKINNCRNIGIFITLLFIIIIIISACCTLCCCGFCANPSKSTETDSTSNVDL